MVCIKDSKHEVVENECLGKKFFVCRVCKEEVRPELKSEETLLASNLFWDLSGSITPRRYGTRMMPGGVFKFVCEEQQPDGTWKEVS